MKQRKAISTQRKKQRKREAAKSKSLIKQFCRMVNSEGTEWGLGREKSATIREIGRVPITGKVNVFVFCFFFPFPFHFQIWELNII